MNNRFYIKELRLTGLTVAPASISFEKGFNVIAGASNTGKSQIVEYLNYMLGADSPPVMIDEAEGYLDAYLEIRAFDNDSPTSLKRSLKKGGFKIANCTIEEFSTQRVINELKAKHSGDENNSISAYLLKRIGFSVPKLVKKNSRNTTKSLSFRDIVRLILVNENRIISKESPIYGGQKSNRTAEESVFQLLLTGEDFSGLKEIEKPELRKGKLSAKIDLVDQLIQEMNEKVSQHPNLEKAIKRKENLESQIKNLSSELGKKVDFQNELMSRKKELWESIETYKSRELLVSEIIKRFAILSSHFSTDLDRLAFIEEGKQLFDQLLSITCPICGNLTNKEVIDSHDSHLLEADSLKEAITAEVAKIRNKQEELGKSLIDLRNEQNYLREKLNDLEEESKGIEKELTDQLEPSKLNTANEINILTLERNQLAEVILIKNNIQNLVDVKTKLRRPPPSIESTDISIKSAGYAILNDLNSQIKKILSDWDYPNLNSVVFDELSNDILISNKPRISNGKGYRAVGFSAFVIGLMRYCMEADLPHTNFVILDSPLTAYKESDEEGDKLPVNIEKAFFKSLSTIDFRSQIIVLDNKEPENELQLKMHYIHFSKNRNIGRYGFFPTISNE